MKSETKISKKERLRLHTLSGDFDFEDLFKELKKVYDEPGFDPELNSVWDFTKVENIEKVSSDQIQKIVAFVSWKRSKYGAMRTALVVSSKIHYGIARMYELSLESASKNEIMVFKDIQEALEWIKV
jgi:hypothetical protein